MAQTTAETVRPERDLIVIARDVAGAFRQRVSHGVPDYRMVATELPVSMTIDKLADECERLRAVNTALLASLEAVEWCGMKAYAAYGPMMPCCPRCEGILPGYMPLGPDCLGHKHGHTADCDLAKAIALAKGGAK